MTWQDDATGVVMDYREALQYITELQKNKGSDYSLEPVRRLCALAGNPDRDLSAVHIAGTNGKGSIGSYLSNILAQSGYTVGRYVSPVLLEYRERIQRIRPKTVMSEREVFSSDPIITEYISEQETAEMLTCLRSLAEQMEKQEEMSPTAFEIETVMAFLMMKQWKVDIAIIECGMGGRTDATNIIESPLMCLFSQIGLDHIAFLGQTEEEITLEKAGILKRGSVAVSVKQDRSVYEILRCICLDQDIPLYIADPQEAEQIKYDMQGTTFRYQGTVFKMGQQGTYQIENAITAITAAYVLRDLGYERIRESVVRDAIASSHWRGRFECVSENPYVIVDGAHNPQAAAELRRSLETYFPEEFFSYIIGVFRDKDYVRMAEEMLPLASRIYTVQPPGERGLEAEVLAETVEKMKRQREYGSVQEGLRQTVQACGSVGEALDLAVQEPERILVFGSLSFLHEVYEYFDVT